VAIKRYNIDICDVCSTKDPNIEESENGEWVKYEDVEKLLEQIRKLEFELMISIPDPYCE
jgi:hypothetical protein